MSDQELSGALALAFLPLHKRALGIAMGAAAGLVVFAATATYLLRAPADSFQMHLLGQYFAGYTVSWIGALVGGAWGFVVGFVAGWFLAFCRNLTIAISVFLVRARSEMEQTRDFLDHI